MTTLNVERARQAIVEHSRRLAASATEAGPDAAVPTAPEWTVAELVAHVGQTQHWVAEMIEQRITDPAKLPTEMAVFPADPAAWQAWLSESAARVASAFSDDALHAPVFNAAGDERSGARFWLDSSLNEAVVHGFDAAEAAGRPADVEADIAAALVSNHLAMLTSPTWELRRSASAHAIRGTGQTLQWLATDDPGAWFVERRPEGATWQHGRQQADVTVSGPAGSLFLTLVRRLPLMDGNATDITIEGDAALVRHWLDNTAHVAD
ncbi:TIGR03083 family protein [Asanoa hainanensis]|uniref:TIGR03083 family protein n=1 Tax=Asanoa hainanensis TaxID=560556 RepID=A0A239H326_9ACTN|nr:maleylpyruvate isomerase family mycothiol-dependent enzyme [Asanoa hainanensis]SNS75819.1 TIGR03083 family protein [Asanoa hainanensis]